MDFFLNRRLPLPLYPPPLVPNFHLKYSDGEEPLISKLTNSDFKIPVQDGAARLPTR